MTENGTLNAQHELNDQPWAYMATPVPATLDAWIPPDALRVEDVEQPVWVYSDAIQDPVQILTDLDGAPNLKGGPMQEFLMVIAPSDRGPRTIEGGQGNDTMVADGVKTAQMLAFLSDHPEDVSVLALDPLYMAFVGWVEGGSAFMPGEQPSHLFVFHSNNGQDRIFNFHPETDRLQIERGLNGSDIVDLPSLKQHLVIDGDNLTLHLGQGHSVTLVGVDIDRLSPANVEWL